MATCTRCGAPLGKEQQTGAICRNCRPSWRRTDPAPRRGRAPRLVIQNTLVPADRNELAIIVAGTLAPDSGEAGGATSAAPSAPGAPNRPAAPEGHLIAPPVDAPPLHSREARTIEFGASPAIPTVPRSGRGTDRSAEQRDPPPRGTQHTEPTGMDDDNLLEQPLRERLLASSHDQHPTPPDYELLEKIGEGGMGVVYRARQKSIDRDVAIKRIQPHAAQRPDRRAKFIREACFTGELAHPNIVPIHDLGRSSDGTLFYAMKMVEGERWENVIADKTRQENLEILLNIADAIAFAHSRNVIHRDLKPENIMLGEFGEVLVMDWGLAAKDNGDQAISPGGSPAYMAPEMAADYLRFIGQHDESLTTAPVGKPSDIYLLGAILFEIVTGKPPHASDKAAGSGQMILECLINAARNVILPVENNNDMLLSIARRALSTDPAERYGTVQEFQQAVRQYQEHALSVGLAERAEEDLRQADQEVGYERYARALFGFQDALELWSDNPKAKDGLRRTRLAYATAALRTANFELGLSVLDPQDQEQRKLQQRLEHGARQRKNRDRRLRLAQFTAAAMLVIAAGATATGWYVSDRERSKAMNLAASEERLRKRAESAAREAELARNEAMDAWEEVLVAWDAALLAEEGERKAKDEALENAEKAREGEREADLARDAERRERFTAEIALASQLVTHDTAAARDKLKAVALNARDLDGVTLDWEWQRLLYRSHPEVRDHQAEGLSPQVAITPDGKWAVSAVLKDGGPRVTLWNVAEQRAADPLSIDRLRQVSPADGLDISEVVAVAISPDGRRVTVAANHGTPPRGLLVSWDLPDREIAEIISDFPELEASSGPWQIQHAVASAGGERLVTVHKSRDFTKGIVWRSQATGWVREGSWYKDKSVGVLAVPQSDRLLFARTQATEHQDPRVEIFRYDLATSTSVIKFDRIVPESSRDVVTSLCISPRRDVFEFASGGETGAIVVNRLPVDAKTGGTEFVLFGHDAHVTALQYSQDGHTLVSADARGVVLVWDLQRRRIHQTLPGHRSAVESLSLSANDQLVTAEENGVLRFWNLVTYSDEYRATATPGTELVTGALSADGNRIVTADNEGMVILSSIAGDKPSQSWMIGHRRRSAQMEQAHYDTKSRLLFTWSIDDGHDSLCVWKTATGSQLFRQVNLASDGLFAVASGGRYLVVVQKSSGDSKPWSIGVIDIASGNVVRAVNGDWGTISAVAPLIHDVDPKVPPRFIAVGDTRGTVRILDLQAPPEHWELAANDPSYRLGRIQQMVVADDGRSIVTVVENNQKRLLCEWTADARRQDKLIDLRNGHGADAQKLVQLWLDELPFAGQARLMTRESKLYVARCYTPEGVDAGDNIRVWHLDGERGFRRPGIAPPAPGGVRDLTLAADETVCVLDLEGNITVWDSQGNAIGQPWKPDHAHTTSRIAACEKDQLLALGDARAVMYRARDGARIREIGGDITDVCWLPIENQLATLRSDGIIRTWDATTGKLLKHFSAGQQGTVTRLLGPLDRTRIAGIVRDDRGDQLWSWNMSADNGSGESLAAVGGTIGVATLQSGAVVMVTSDQQVLIWQDDQLQAYRFVEPLPSNATCVALSRDRRRLVVGMENGEAFAYEVGGEKQTLVAQYRLGPQREVSRSLTALAWTPQGHRIVTGDASGAVRLWLLPTHSSDGGDNQTSDGNDNHKVVDGKELLLFPGHRRPIRKLQFSTGDAPSLLSLDAAGYQVIFSAPMEPHLPGETSLGLRVR